MSKNSFEFDSRQVRQNLAILGKKVSTESEKLLETVARVDVETGAKEIITQAGHVITGDMRRFVQVRKITSLHIDVVSVMHYSIYVHRITPFMKMALERAIKPLQSGFASILRNIKL